MRQTLELRAQANQKLGLVRRAHQKRLPVPVNRKLELREQPRQTPELALPPRQSRRQMAAPAQRPRQHRSRCSARSRTPCHRKVLLPAPVRAKHQMALPLRFQKRLAQLVLAPPERNRRRNRQDHSLQQRQNRRQKKCQRTRRSPVSQRRSRHWHRKARPWQRRQTYLRLRQRHLRVRTARRTLPWLAGCQRGTQC